MTARVLDVAAPDTQSAVARRILVLTTSSIPEAEIGRVVRAHGGEDAEVHIVAPASKISRLDRLTNAEDDARAEAADRAEAAADAVPAPRVEAHVGDVDPVRAIEDALRMYPADEVIVISAPDDETNWLESDLGKRVGERLPVPVTHLTTA